MYIIYVVHNTYKMTIYIQVISTFMYMYSLKRPTHAGALEIRLKKSNCIEIVDVLQQYCQKKAFKNGFQLRIHPGYQIVNLSLVPMHVLNIPSSLPNSIPSPSTFILHRTVNLERSHLLEASRFRVCFRSCILAGHSF